MLTLAVLAIAFVVALVHQPSRSSSFLPTPARILLVTAHPDDESFFFAPTLLSLLTRPPLVFSLCLSIGDADGLGAIRKDELASSLDVLGVDESRRWVVDSPCVFHVSIPFSLHDILGT
jgi:N-acetylglucosaminylphosphatidylinositol deacetylase